MPKKTLLVVCVAMTLSITGLSSAQLMPFPDISEDTSTLLKGQKQAIEARIGWWKNKLLIADTVDAISDSCEKLMQDYAKSENRTYKNFFVASCVEQYLPLLGEKSEKIPLDDKLRMEKIIQVASLLSQLRDRAILPALQSMSVSKNPALRLLAWEGYKNSRGRFITSRKTTDGMLKTIGNALNTEKDPIVLQAIYNLMNFRGIDVDLVSESTLKKINNFFLNTLEATWNARRLGVMEGKAEKIDRATEEAAILGYLGSVRGVSQTTKTKVLQMLLDMASSAADVYDRTLKEETRDPKANKACVLLLLECEQNLNGVAEMQNQSLTKALASDADPGAAVLGAIFTWSDELKKMGVKTPKAPGSNAAVAPKEKTE